MAGISDLISWILTHYQEVIAASSGVVLALIALAVVIPGDQPEKFLQGVADFLAKISRK